KVDRKALPAPAVEAARSAGAGTPLSAAAAPLVELLAGIWAEVLGRDELPGAQDNFFEQGGHSLLVTRVVAGARAACAVALRVRPLSAARPPAALAAALAALLRAGSAAAGGAAPPPPPLAPLPPAARAGDLALSFAQQRLWFLDRLDPGSPVY